ncbi:PH domain-containing protein [Nitriliruptor alkaliphilus]|uniref:PH domain-containing protein n=1 Tax=Nitriliruptor alkaliphilus TaxID=427918 RepID=UPI0006987381|nr:PH domain-containing protein [Nitriliruptor alkaliphilus]
MPGGPRPAAEIPDLDDRDRPLDPRVITVWRFSTVTSMLLPTAVLTAVAVGFLGSPNGWLVPAVLVVLTAVLAAWYPGARYERWRWRLTDLAVELERGVIVRQAEALPYFRIQQIDVAQGPIDRLLGLASLQVTSASASGSVTLPGIAADEAPGIRRALLARASSAVQGHDAGVRDAV